VSVSPARNAAFEILMRVETTDAYASELLHSSRFEKLSTADHALLTELVMGVLRWRRVLDDKITAFSTQPLARLDREVLTALRLGTYQLLFLDRIPAHAAIHESVELVKQARKRSAAGMVNAVLRKVLNSHFSQNRAVVAHPTFDYSSTHPIWLVERWTETYGQESTQKICSYDQAAPATAIRIGFGASRQRNIAEAKGKQFAPGRLLAHAAIASGDVTRSAAFREHRLMIQDEASQLVALLVGEGKNILDCCAAPGGKTRIIAQQNPDATVVALDLHQHRAALMRRLVTEANVRIMAGDIRQTPFSKEFDRVLVDAPCSGTGTIARNPEIKWRLKLDDVARLQQYQVEILTSAMKHVAAGGRLVYSTCSLEPEENQQVVERVLAGDVRFRVLDGKDELRKLQQSGELTWSDLDSLLTGPYLRTLPGVHPCDGFFAAVLQKN
jgi:16S rRNA (cytosine967-C5)-methyltransferase